MSATAQCEAEYGCQDETCPEAHSRCENTAVARVSFDCIENCGRCSTVMLLCAPCADYVVAEFGDRTHRREL